MIDRNIFDNAKALLQITFDTGDYECIMYKGFKLMSFPTGDMILKDTRTNDFYTDPTKKDLRVINRYGFIEGIDRIVHQRNLLRVDKYEKKILELHKHKSELLKNKKKIKLFDKKYRIVEEHLANSVDLLFFYKSRIIQFNKKYVKIKNKTGHP